MSKIIYNFTIFLYRFFIGMASFFNEKAQKMTKGREYLWENLAEKLAGNHQKTAWFHCASLGEFEQGRPVIEAFAEAFPDYKIVLTFFSPSGFEVRKNYDKAHVISYLPYDTAHNAARFLEIIKPSIAIFVKYEFWYHYLSQLNARQIPTILISANFRANQVFFKPYGQFFRSILKSFNHIFVQNMGSGKLLQSVGYQQITLAGDTRFDRVFDLAKNIRTLPIIESFKSTAKLFVLGSAWEQDFHFLLPFFNQMDATIKVVIAPHEINASEIAKWQAKLNAKSIKYSDIQGDTESLAQNSVLFIDNIGMLSSIYSYADFVWIGGSFGKGLHNILEAATFGKPIFFGDKNYRKFQEAVDLVKKNGAFVFGEYEAFYSKFTELNTKPDYYQNVCEISRNYVENNLGATPKIMKWINNTLQNTEKYAS